MSGFNPSNRRIELSRAIFSSKMHSSRASTESFHLILKYCFEELGYHRIGWKCNVKNEKSRSSALRYGFTYEGIIRSEFIMYDHSYDPCSYSLLSHEWPTVKQEFERWLGLENFDESGRQKTKFLVKY